tara:strand:+ start:156 stop:626 length:471 start_codon:yes stop_codon:yes gene_type:complete
MNSNIQPQIFVSFSTKDMKICKEFIQKLSSSDFDFWYQEDINLGQEYKKIIKQNINSSVASVLLLSQNFLDSEFIKTQEMPWIYEKDEKSMIYEIFPIQIETCGWQSIDYLEKKQVFPAGGASLDLNNKKHLNLIYREIFNYLENAGYIERKGWFR